MGLFQSKPALLRQEASLRQALVATALEQLTGEDALTFDLMDKTLSEMQCGLTECLEQCAEGRSDGVVEGGSVCTRKGLMDKDHSVYVQTNTWSSIGRTSDSHP